MDARIFLIFTHGLTHWQFFANFECRWCRCIGRRVDGLPFHRLASWHASWPIVSSRTLTVPVWEIWEEENLIVRKQKFLGFSAMCALCDPRLYKWCSFSAFIPHFISSYMSSCISAICLLVLKFFLYFLLFFLTMEQQMEELPAWRTWPWLPLQMCS